MLRTGAVGAVVSRVVWEFPPPLRPRPPSTGTPSPLGFTPEVLSPWGNSSTPGVSMPLGNLTPPPTPCQSPAKFSATPEALGPPSLPPTPEDSTAALFCRPTTLSLSPRFTPCRPLATASSASSEMTYQMSPLPAAAPPGNYPSTLPSDSRAVVVCT